MDYRGLNAVTIKNRYPLPLINDNLDRLQEVQIYTKLDLRGAYNLLDIQEGEGWQTAFRTRYLLFEYLVLPFGLTNATAMLQNFMNDALGEHIDIFFVVYLDDILIYSDTEAEYTVHVRAILNMVHAVGVCCKPEKREFHVTTTSFLGYVVSANGVTMSPGEVEAILTWNTPASVQDIQFILRNNITN